MSLVALLLASIVYHNHPQMNGLQEELKSKAPTMFKLFLAGEAVYFAGMVLMAAGLGASLGAKPWLWKSKLQSMLSAESPGLAKAKLFWAGFACNVIGSLTFGLIGLYVASQVLPGGAKTLVPASLVDICFSLFVRAVFFRRFTRKP